MGIQNKVLRKTEQITGEEERGWKKPLCLSHWKERRAISMLFIKTRAFSAEGR